MDTPFLLVGIDTCVLLSLAEHDKLAWQSVRAIRAHASQRAIFALTPTVMKELGNFSGDYSDTERQGLAADALDEIGGTALHDFMLSSFTDEQFQTVELAARRLRREGLLPREEWHDTKLICEAAMLGCAYLLTDDTHLLGAPRQRLSAVLRQQGLHDTRIISYHAAL